jgi:hypothetical protein
MEADDRVVGFIKFARREFIEDFVSGRLYMNTLAYFAGLERSDVRCDEREGNTLWFPRGESTIIQMEIDGKYKTIPGVTDIRYSNPDDRNTNVFCMYALRAKAKATGQIDSRVVEFGNTFAVVLDGNEFLRRVRVAAKSVGLTAKCSPVQYVDKLAYDGHVGPFRKASNFSYQSEFRIALCPGARAAYVLNVGDLSDITEVSSVTEAGCP